MMDFVLASKSVPELPVRREPSQGEMMPNLWGVFEDEGLAFRLITSLEYRALLPKQLT